ncbi:tRNA pseudouridine(38-40) synthase TruA [Gracilibacillus alcaliphilus]|uniref:tRNA pseudouridine(38-40) synthase TruA n=1 Tax=Gracilibacillus alcaliphilus TaxID=1401441 RepID=UPI00195637D9|nr:tRNA pseudouridine(38-40) synthase TruA [Gracilibacillus alcaliphilus]MBM7677373.1 tRNA pseudouridine38-40 synthase [Gracilibacillus alcaliphilus]
MRWKAKIRYDGTQFSGYQIQPNTRTIQGELEAVLSKMHKGRSIRVTASGRTDQGVHAIGQVIHFDTDLNIPAPNWVKALNTMLPDDIEVADMMQVSESFHARFDVAEKEYHYVIGTGEYNLFQRHYRHFIEDRLDVKAMQTASQFLLGTHDFSSFCAANHTLKGDKVRTITAVKVEPQADQLIIAVRGTGFLYNMVRIIAGTLIEVGLGQREPEQLQKIIAAENRSAAGKTAPAQGLYLWAVKYKN